MPPVASSASAAQTTPKQRDAGEAFQPYVDSQSMPQRPDSPQRVGCAGKRAAGESKDWAQMQGLLAGGRQRELKSALREEVWPTDSQLRSRLWPALCRRQALPGAALQQGFYWDLVLQLFGSAEAQPEPPPALPIFVERECALTYHLSSRGRAVADRVVCVLGFACPQITYGPAIYPVIALLLHFLTEEECYHCITCLVLAKDRTFLTQTKQLHEVTWRTVMEIARKHVSGAAAHLARLCSDTHADRLYARWLWWILQDLPFAHLVRVMDCYLNEGIKVFCRIAMAILVLFQKHTSSPNSEWSKEILRSGPHATFSKFCKMMPEPPARLLRAAFGIRLLSSAYISRVFLKTETVLKSHSAKVSASHLNHSQESIPSNQSQVTIQKMPHSFSVKELFSLWSWLPARITINQPVLLYTTEEDGCSLKTFFLKVDEHEPTLLVIMTNKNEVFGAYCSTRWGERNTKDSCGKRHAYFGTGETFLFSLCPRRAKYPWVGIHDANGGRQVQHAAELFMAADSSMITIGGGEGQGIWMDENIRFGKTDRCLTFNNPPLCDSRDFEIRALAVYGFI